LSEETEAAFVSSIHSDAWTSSSCRGGHRNLR
jgi:hypothetical protein